MNKTISILLALVLCLSLCACGSTSNPPETNAPVESNAPPETNAPTETQTAVYAENEFKLEVIGYDATPAANIVNIDFKFRNMTEQDFGRVVFTVQALDANGDVIESTVMGEENLGAGQAAWFTFQTNDSRSCKTIEELSEKIDTVKVISVQVMPNVNDAGTYYTLTFDAPILVKVAEVQPKE